MRLDGYLFCNIMYNNYVLFSVIVYSFFIYLFSALSIVYCKNCFSVIYTTG